MLGINERYVLGTEVARGSGGPVPLSVMLIAVGTGAMILSAEYKPLVICTVLSMSCSSYGVKKSKLL